MVSGPACAQRVVRVLIADDHALLRWTLGELIASDPTLDLVASCVDGESAVEEVARLHPDVVVMDLKMPGMGGIEATRRIVHADPQTRVLILTGHVGQNRRSAALSAGAACVLTKDTDPHQLLDLIRERARPGA